MFTFAEFVTACRLPLYYSVAAAPQTPGYYLLFGQNGEFIYVGKTDNLQQRLHGHYQSTEQNAIIRQHLRFSAWFPTNTVAEAEIGEGKVYDAWVSAAGARPMANVNRPPRAAVDEQLAARQALLRLFGIQ